MTTATEKYEKVYGTKKDVLSRVAELKKTDGVSNVRWQSRPGSCDCQTGQITPPSFTVCFTDNRTN